MKHMKIKSESMVIKKSLDKNSKIGQNQYLAVCSIFKGPKRRQDPAGGGQLKKLRYQLPSGGGECYSQGPSSNLGISSHSCRYVINQTHHSMCSGYCLTSKFYYNILTTFIHYLCSDNLKALLAPMFQITVLSALKGSQASQGQIGNTMPLPTLKKSMYHWEVKKCLTFHLLSLLKLS